MKRAVNYLQGDGDPDGPGLFPERLLNLCAQEGVACWALEWTDSHTMRLTTYRRSLPPAAPPGPAGGLRGGGGGDPGTAGLSVPVPAAVCLPSSGWPSPCWR